MKTRSCVSVWNRLDLENTRISTDHVQESPMTLHNILSSFSLQQLVTWERTSTIVEWKVDYLLM